ncbi:MAG: H-type lectin domain-containing protein [Thermodesulfobacteriota bacterium]|nr:H-type lectin domain-containing protein [Thermodesulfobacteriota bacterium]
MKAKMRIKKGFVYPRLSCLTGVPVFRALLLVICMVVFTAATAQAWVEVGDVSVGSSWKRASFNKTFQAPVVVAKSSSYTATGPAVVRIRSVDQAGFEIRLQEWDYLDGSTALETTGYIVMEQGVHTLPDGTRVEAGQFETKRTGFEQVPFSQTFQVPPVVITAVCSDNEVDAVTTRVRNVSTTGFEIRMQEQQLNQQVHAYETISYIAWEPSSVIVDGLVFEVNRTGNEVRHDWHRMAYNMAFENAPVFVADMQTQNGGDTANIRWDNKDAHGVDVKIAEEQSKDSETAHVMEVVGYVIVDRGPDTWSQIFNYDARETTAMVEFGETIYVGTGSWTASVRSAAVYRMVDEGCKIWEAVDIPWDPCSEKVMSMAVFDGYLYVGTDCGEVFRTQDGFYWSVAAPPGTLGPVFDMAEFKGHLYVCGGYSATIWRTQDGTSWEPMVGPVPAFYSYGFGDPSNNDISSLEVFNGFLYAGVGRDNANGIQLWRSADGKWWEKFKEELPPPGGISIGLTPGHIHALKAFKGHLYVGQYHGNGVFRTDGTANSWEDLSPITQGQDVFRLEEHNGKLYLGVRTFHAPSGLAGSDLGTPLVYASTNGTQWSPVPGAPVVDSRTEVVSSFLSRGGRLYVGTGGGYGDDERSGVYACGASPGPTCCISGIDPWMMHELRPLGDEWEWGSGQPQPAKPPGSNCWGSGCP